MSARTPALSDAAYYLHEGHPCLRVDVAGRTAHIDAEAKPSVFAAGLVYLGDGFEDVCPPVTLRPPGGGPTTLEGFSSDPRLFRLFEAFLQAADSDSFGPGPVAIPD